MWQAGVSLNKKPIYIAYANLNIEHVTTHHVGLFHLEKKKSKSGPIAERFVGMYHPDNPNQDFRFPDHLSTKAVYGKASSAMVLQLVPDASEVGYTLQWQTFTGTIPANALVINTTQDGRAMYAARAAITSKGVVMTGQPSITNTTPTAVGTFIRNIPNGTETGQNSGEVYIPFKSTYSQPETFQLLVATPQHPVVPNPVEPPTTQLRSVFVGASFAAYYSKNYNKYAAAANLTSPRFFASAMESTFSPACTEIFPWKSDDPDSYMNLGYVGIGGPTGNSNQIVVGFRGTIGRVEDWANNFLAAPYALQVDGRTLNVHTGFYFAMLSLYNEVRGAIEDLLAQGEHHTIYLAGHSKGGAMANLAALLLAQDFPGMQFQVMTFGAPRAGDRHFANLYELTIPYSFAWISESDPVPMVPLSGETVTGLGYLWNALGGKWAAVGQLKASAGSTVPALQASKLNFGEQLLLRLIDNTCFAEDAESKVLNFQATAADVANFSQLADSLFDIKASGKTPQKKIQSVMQQAETLLAGKDFAMEFFYAIPGVAFVTEPPAEFENERAQAVTLLALAILFRYVPGLLPLFESSTGMLSKPCQSFVSSMEELNKALAKFESAFGTTVKTSYEQCGTVQFVAGLGSDAQVFTSVSDLVFIAELIETISDSEQGIFDPHSAYKSWL